MSAVLIRFESTEDATTLRVHRSSDADPNWSNESFVTELVVAHRDGPERIEQQIGQLILIAIAYSGDAPRLKELLRGRVHEAMNVAASVLHSKADVNSDNLLQLGLLTAARAVTAGSEELIDEADSIIRRAAQSGSAEAIDFLARWPAIKEEYLKQCRRRS